MTRRTLIASSALAAVLTGCGGSTPAPEPAPSHALSAATACSDFAAWYRAAQPDLSDAAKTGDLILAAASAPSGQLYQDLSTLEGNVLTASKATGSLRQAEDGMLVSGAYTVEQDCQNVNPGS